MTVELDIENKLAGFLRENLIDIEVEANNIDIGQAINRALMHPNGLIIVSHYNMPIMYDVNFPNNATGFSIIRERFAITVLSKNRRERDGVYEYLDKCRELCVKFNYHSAYPKLINHSISPQKFPDYENGVYVSELVIEISLKYPFTFKLD